jgi:hypothetical protein
LWRNVGYFGVELFRGFGVAEVAYVGHDDEG